MNIAVGLFYFFANWSTNKQIFTIRTEAEFVSWKSIGKLTIMKHWFAKGPQVPNFKWSISISSGQSEVIIKTNDRRVILVSIMSLPYHLVRSMMVEISLKDLKRTIHTSTIEFLTIIRVTHLLNSHITSSLIFSADQWLRGKFFLYSL